MPDTLKDFLVGIGFKVDKASQVAADAAIDKTEAKATKATASGSAKRKKIEKQDAAERKRRFDEETKREQERQSKSLKSLETFASRATKLFAADAIIRGIEKIGSAVDAAASKFERLNYVSRMSGSTAGGASAFGYAAGQLGGSAGEAQAQLTAFGQKLKTYQGYEARLKSLGIKTREANGAFRETADIATDLGDKLRDISKDGKNGYGRSLATGQLFGFDGMQAQAMMRPEFRKYQDQQKGDAAKIGANQNAAAESGTAFEQSMRRLDEVLEQIGTKINGVLFVKLKPLLDQLAAWFLANGDKIADIVGQIADGLIKLARAIGDDLASADWKTILDNVKDFAGSLGALLGKLSGEAGLVAMIVALAVGLRSLSVLAMPPWVLALLGISAAGVVGARALHEHASQGDGSYADAQRDQANGGGVAGWWRKNAPGYLGGGMNGNDGVRARGSKAAATRRASGPDGIPYKATSLKEAMGLTDGEYDAYREGVTDIEGKNYGRMGGAGGRFAGRYQMGASEITETARRLGVPRPSTEQFLRDPEMQEKFFENYTADHYNTLMRNKKFALMSKREKLQILGYAHNQGTGGPSRENGAWGYVDGHGAGSDAFGTSGTAYFGPIGSRFDKTQGPVKTPPMLKAKPLGDARTLVPGYVPGQPQGLKSGGYMGEGLDASGKPVALTPQHTSYRGDTNITHAPTFNIAGGDAHQNMDAARLTASRGHQDLLRNTQGILA